MAQKCAKKQAKNAFFKFVCHFLFILAKNEPKTGKKLSTFKKMIVIIFLAQTTQQNGTSYFHTMF